MDEKPFDIWLDHATATDIVRLALKLGIPVDELLTKILEAGLAEHIRKN
jgi:hypothetical protein